MRASDLCDTSASLLVGDRASAHGDKAVLHQRIADLWSVYLGGRARITAVDVAQMMTLLKIARTTTGAHNLDNYIDGIGYQAIAGELAERAAQS